MYQPVPKQEVKELKAATLEIIKEVQKSFLKDYFTFEFNLIGSGANNLIMKNGDDGSFDLDYNFIIRKDKKGLINNPKKIKDLFIQAFNETNPNLGFNPANNSTSVITSRLVYNNRLKFSFDVAILAEGNNGNYYKITWNKDNGQYYWNEVKHSRNFGKKIANLKKNKLWDIVRETYFDKKNYYLSKQYDKASFAILNETLNEVCDKYGVKYE